MFLFNNAKSLMLFRHFISPKIEPPTQKGFLSLAHDNHHCLSHVTKTWPQSDHMTQKGPNWPQPNNQSECPILNHSTDMSSPGSQAGLLLTGTPSTTELNSRIEALDLATREPRPSTSTSVSTIWLSWTSSSPRRGNISNKVESQVTQTTRRSYEKTEKMWIYTLRSIAPHGIYGSNQTDSHTPHSTSRNALINVISRMSASMCWGQETFSLFSFKIWCTLVFRSCVVYNIVINCIMAS